MTTSDAAVDAVTELTSRQVCWLYGGRHVAEVPGFRLLAADPPTDERSSFAPVRGLLRRLLPLVDGDLVVECAPELRYLLGPEGLPESRPLSDLMQMPTGVSRMLPLESELVFRIVVKVGLLVQEGLRRRGEEPLVFFPRFDRADRPTTVLVHHLWVRGVRLVLGSPARHPWWERVGGAEVTLPGDPPPCPPGDDEEARAVRAARRALSLDLPDAADAWRAAVDVAGRWFNPGVVLDLAPLTEGRVPETERAESLGVALATLGRFHDAREQFDRGYAAATTPVDRARLAMFTALVSAKRLSDMETAQAGVTRGLADLAECDTEDAQVALERAWLLNLEALVAYRAGDHDAAMRSTRTALQLTKPYRDEDCVAVKTNLVVNTSIIFETRGEPRRALKVWSLFLRIFDRAGDMFVHFYHFRQAGLLAKAGDPLAVSVYERVAAMAADLGHLPSLLYSTRALARLTYLAGDTTAARAHAARLLELCVRCGDVPGLARAWCLLAACHAAAGATSDAGSALDQAVSTAASDAERAQLADLRSGWHAGEVIDWAAQLPGPPPTTLRYPSTLFLP
ncbi:hypothetical protein [Saccharothrix sp. NRRL B-16314]|uniref:hypothetical protein n=1 Tax=Saccharothrix sp. NRRL B-16314 TaxID=1463825 RepID=UPI000526FB38|nr:hypothetical protein [Saccharothrix sp. NRRL B-16314]